MHVAIRHLLSLKVDRVQNEHLIKSKYGLIFRTH